MGKTITIRYYVSNDDMDEGDELIERELVINSRQIISLITELGEFNQDEDIEDYDIL